MNESILLVVKAVAVMGALGAVFGLVLGFASKVFAVEKDPREEAISGCLPGLSAAMGVALKGIIDTIESNMLDADDVSGMINTALGVIENGTY